MSDEITENDIVNVKIYEIEDPRGNGLAIALRINGKLKSTSVRLRDPELIKQISHYCEPMIDALISSFIRDGDLKDPFTCIKEKYER
jgi:hypothetical protein